MAAFPSYYTLLWRAKTRLDDSLDVFAGHGVGGITGALLTGVFAEKAWNGVADGLLFGNPAQLGIQAVAVLAAVLYSALGTFLLLKLVGLFTPLRASPREEGTGLDVTQHGEEAYTSGEGAILVPSESLPPLPKAGRWEVRREAHRGHRPPGEARRGSGGAFQGGGPRAHPKPGPGPRGETEKVETYRGTTVKMELHEKVRLEIGVSEPFVKPTVEAILKAARTGEVGDGKVFVIPVEKVYRIRTGEEDEAAVTPVQ